MGGRIENAGAVAEVNLAVSVRTYSAGDHIVELSVD